MTQFTHPLREGLQVIMDHWKGRTHKDVLKFPFLFQCPPLETFDIEYAYSHAEYDTANNGQFSRPSGQQLTAVSFSTLVVDQGYYRLHSRRTIESLTDELKLIMTSGTPFLFTAAHHVPPRNQRWDLLDIGPEIQMHATLRSLKQSERAGEGDARYLDVEFRQYREPLVAQKTKKKRHGGKHWPQIVRLYKDGHALDEHGKHLGHPPRKPVTLGLLAKHYYGKPKLGHVIAKANGIHNWGRNSPLIKYSKYKHSHHWPVKIKIPNPPRTDEQVATDGGVNIHQGGAVYTGSP